MPMYRNGARRNSFGALAGADCDACDVQIEADVPWLPFPSEGSSISPVAPAGVTSCVGRREATSIAGRLFVGRRTLGADL